MPDEKRMSSCAVGGEGSKWKSVMKFVFVTALLTNSQGK